MDIGHKAHIKRSIIVIKQYKKGSYGLSAVGIVIILVISGCSFVNTEGTTATSHSVATVDLNSRERQVLDTLYKYRADLKAMTMNVTRNGSGRAVKVVTFMDDGKEVARAEFDQQGLYHFIDHMMPAVEKPDSQKEEQFLRDIVGVSYDQYNFVDFNTSKIPKFRSGRSPVVNGIDSHNRITAQISSDGKLRSYVSEIGNTAPEQYPSPSEVKSVKEVEQNFDSMVKLITKQIGGQVKPVYVVNYSYIDAKTGSAIGFGKKNEEPEINANQAGGKIISKKEAAEVFLKQFPLQLRYDTNADSTQKPVLVYEAERALEGKPVSNLDYFGRYSYVDARTGEVISPIQLGEPAVPILH